MDETVSKDSQASLLDFERRSGQAIDVVTSIGCIVERMGDYPNVQWVVRRSAFKIKTLNSLDELEAFSKSLKAHSSNNQPINHTSSKSDTSNTKALTSKKRPVYLIGGAIAIIGGFVLIATYSLISYLPNASIAPNTYHVKSDSNAFAGVSIGARLLDIGKQDDSPDESGFLTADGVRAYGVNNLVEIIGFACPQKNHPEGASKGSASIDGVTCGMTVKSIREQLGSYEELCTPTDTTDHLIVKGNAYFLVTKNPSWGVDLLSFGITSRRTIFNNIHQDPYVSCSSLNKAKASDASNQPGSQQVYRLKGRKEYEVYGVLIKKYMSEQQISIYNDVEKLLTPNEQGYERGTRRYDEASDIYHQTKKDIQERASYASNWACRYAGEYKNEPVVRGNREITCYVTDYKLFDAMSEILLYPHKVRLKISSETQVPTVYKGDILVVSGRVGECFFVGGRSFPCGHVEENGRNWRRHSIGIEVDSFKIIQSE